MPLNPPCPDGFREIGTMWMHNSNQVMLLCHERCHCLVVLADARHHADACAPLLGTAVAAGRRAVRRVSTASRRRVLRPAQQAAA